MESTMKVYLAGPYQNKEQIKTCAAEVREAGIIVTSSWLNEPHKPTVGPQDLTYEQNQKYAIQDIMDVRSAEIFVLFTEPTKTIFRAGRHVEFGVAVERGMPIFVVGEEFENIFHYLPRVTHFPSWERLRDAMIVTAHVAACQ
jgi:nucleoside 2-deoxyribosyltransferase